MNNILNTENVFDLGKIIKNLQIHISKESVDFKEKFNFVSLFVKIQNSAELPKESKSVVSTYESILREYESFFELDDEDPLGRGDSN